MTYNVSSGTLNTTIPAVLCDVGSGILVAVSAVLGPAVDVHRPAQRGFVRPGPGVRSTLGMSCLVVGQTAEIPSRTGSKRHVVRSHVPGKSSLLTTLCI